MINDSEDCNEHDKDIVNIEAQLINPLMNSKIKKMEDNNDTLRNIA